MKKFLITLIGCLAFGFATLGQQNLTDVEYFFDVDPGVGNATNIDVSDTVSLDTTFNIPVNDLPSGIHILHIRGKNADNKWSIYSRQTLYIANFSSTLNQTLVAAEYFVDTDPGVGNATSLSITNGASLNTSAAIPLTDVSTGIHILHLRVKNSLNKWSIYARQVFYKSPQILNNTVVAAEYFVDIDPGVGNAEDFPISQGANVNEFLSIPLTSISEGIHILHVRVKNNSNRWSLYARQVFYKSPQLLDNEIVTAEYFIDEDPGVGSATSIAITQGESVDEILNIAIPDDLAEGDHVLHLRVLRSDGKWSLYGRPEFETLSVRNLTLENFKLYPNPVTDILNLSLPNETLEHVKIIDATGKMVLEKTNHLEKLNVSHLASGMYLVQIKTSVGSISKKIIKK